MNLGFLLNKAYAQVTGPLSSGNTGGALAINNPIGISNFGQLVQCVITYFTVYIAPAILVLMILYGAFRMLVAGGEPEKFASGRKVILYAIIGYIVVLIAAGLVSVVLSVLGGSSVAAVCPLSF